MIDLDFSKTGGLLPAIAQEAGTGEVLMLAYMNQEAWETTLATGRATYFSRSRQELWVKGLHLELPQKAPAQKTGNYKQENPAH